MADLTDLALPETGRLAENIAHFGRALRKAGLKAGPGKVLDAVRAVEAVGFTDRRDFYHTLAAVFVARPEERAVFAETFRLFWRDPRYLEQLMSLMLPAVRGTHEERVAQAGAKRAAEALLDGAPRDPPELPERDEGEELEIDARPSQSAEERLRTLDFEQMSLAEIAEAKRMVARLKLAAPPLATRRTRPGAGALPDWRATLRASLRTGGEPLRFATRARRQRPPDLVALCDISGSMSSYSRMVLHFLHAAANAAGAAGRARAGGWGRVHAFTFGTRLTNITRHLAARDVDAALAAAGAEAQDWQGGTRIGACLHAFNRDWSRRVLSRGAVVLLITDGLDRGDPAALATEIERLHLSARRLVWVNPLLRWEGFAPRAGGIRAMLPHVDSFRAGHSVASLEALAAALGQGRDGGERGRLMAALAGRARG
ncbi:vWA domain-containing protein [Frigidibacter sp. MR17.24]|uniref:vWA domain-containing protein n=1 Tax=Frigidibacter sp. MR17.24 TaxID=3127345 RepID=UPI003012E21C